MSLEIPSSRGIARLLGKKATMWFDAATKRLRWVGPDGTTRYLLDSRDSVGGGGGVTSVNGDSGPAVTIVVPTSGEKAALAGTNGTPGSGNKYVTDSDIRNTNSRAPSGSAGGDLDGSFPNPGVAKVKGVAISNTPTSGQALVATSTTTAAWTSLLLVVAVSSVPEIAVGLNGSAASTGTLV